MINKPVVLERWGRVAPFGVRFWDSVTRSIVSEGLHVSAVHATHQARTLRAWPNRSGVFVVHETPELREFGRGAGDAAFWAEFPPTHPYIWTVEDTLRRFLPFRFEARLPVQGMFVLDCLPIESPPSAPTDALPLFGGSSRAGSSGQAMLYADLWDAAGDRPAAWAVIQVSAPGMPPVRGMADADGRLALLFPYPEPPTPPVSSPTSGARRALTELAWTLRLDAQYAPQTPVPAVPDLCAALTQPPAQLWQDVSRTQLVTTAELAFCRALVLRSDLPLSFKPQAVLLLTPS